MKWVFSSCSRLDNVYVPYLNEGIFWLGCIFILIMEISCSLIYRNSWTFVENQLEPKTLILMSL